MPDIHRIDQNQRRSRGVVHNGFIFLAGQVGNDMGGDVRQQASEAFAKVDDMLSQAGSDKTRVMSVTIWLRDLEDYDAFNEVWDQWIVQGQSPARACAKAQLADPRARVELIVIAATAAA